MEGIFKDISREKPIFKTRYLMPHKNTNGKNP